MGLDAFKKLSSLTRLGGKLSASMGSPFGITPGIGFPIGIDFGVGSLKVLQLEESFPPRLVAAARHNTPDELVTNHEKRLEFQAAALGKLVREGGFRGKRAMCAIPAWATFCRPVHVQRADGVEMKSLLEGALTAQLGMDPAGLVYRSIEVGQPGRGEMLVMGVARELVNRLMRAINGAKLEPVGMHHEFASIVKSFDYMHRRAGDAEQTTLYLDIGCISTNLMIAHGTQLAFARRIEIGGRHLDETVAKQLGVSIGEAARLRMSIQGAVFDPARRVHAQRPLPVGVGAGDGPEPERREGGSPVGFSGELSGGAQVEVAPNRTDLSEPLEILTDEVKLSLRHHAAQSGGRRVNRVVFLGGEARHKGVCQHIARALRLPAQAADPMTWVQKTGQEKTGNVDFRQPQPGWTTALGLCLSPTDL